MDNIENFINLIKSTFGRYKGYSGGCYKFHLILKMVYPKAIGYYNGEHVITKIDGQFYDIDGKIEGDVSYSFRQIRENGDYTYEFMEKIFKEYLN